MNVLFLVHRYPPAVGGSERFVREMARRLVEEGHQATVYTSDLLAMEGFWRHGRARLDSGVELDGGVEVHRFRARVLPLHGVVSRLLGLVPWPPLGLAMAPPGMVVPGLWKAVRAGGDFNVVHASAYPSLIYLGAVAARRSRARLVVMPCTHASSGMGAGDLRDSLQERVIRLYRQADALIALTERERALFIAAGIADDKVEITGAGVNPEEAMGADGGRFRARYGLPSDARVIAFVGHKTVGKGAFDLLEACRPLLDERPELVVVMAGEPTPAFTRRYEALPGHLRARVMSVQPVEAQKHDLLASSSLLALPSRDDSFGIVLLEAWLHGKAVVGAKAGGIPDVIEDGQSGLLVPYGDVVALTRAIAWLLDHPVEAAEMGACGRERLLQRWTWASVYERVRGMYERVGVA